MSVASLFNIPSDDKSLSHFAFANAAEHHKIAQAIFDQLDTRVDSFILDPIPMMDMGGWLYNHQQAHNVQNAILGIAGNDLTGVDFRNPGQMAAWLWLHGEEHRRASDVLGLA
jgi:hypothetical protein